MNLFMALSHGFRGQIYLAAEHYGVQRALPSISEVPELGASESRDVFHVDIPLSIGSVLYGMHHRTKSEILHRSASSGLLMMEVNETSSRAVARQQRTLVVHVPQSYVRSLLRIDPVSFPGTLSACLHLRAFARVFDNSLRVSQTSAACERYHRKPPRLLSFFNAAEFDPDRRHSSDLLQDGRRIAKP